MTPRSYLQCGAQRLDPRMCSHAPRRASLYDGPVSVCAWPSVVLSARNMHSVHAASSTAAGERPKSSAHPNKKPPKAANAQMRQSMMLLQAACQRSMPLSVCTCCSLTLHALDHRQCEDLPSNRCGITTPSCTAPAGQICCHSPSEPRRCRQMTTQCCPPQDVCTGTKLAARCTTAGCHKLRSGVECVTGCPARAVLRLKYQVRLTDCGPAAWCGTAGEARGPWGATRRAPYVARLSKTLTCTVRRAL
jgi:hypothetical protein